MGDARTKTRTTVGSMLWMAPEVLEKPYDERSDVWSLGCILLEMATCGFLDAAQMSSVLCELKTSPQALEDVLESCLKTYSASLCQVIRTMLRRNFQQRPTAQELLEIPFVIECLALNNSALVDGFASMKMEKEIKGLPVPKEEGVDAVVAFMKSNESNRLCQKNALLALQELAEARSVISDGCKRTVADAMRRHIACEEVQSIACRLLASLTSEAEEGDVLYTRHVISPVALAMKSHPASAKLQAAATHLLMALSADEAAAKEIGKLGGVQDILAALRSFPSDVEIATNCLGALWGLAVDEANAKIVTEERGLQDICQSMDRHDKAAELIESACSALWSLSLEDENIEVMSDLGVTRLLLTALKNHKKDAKVVKNALMALASIVEADESCAYEVLTGDDEVPGTVTLLNAFKLHETNGEVVENFACGVAALAEYEDIRAELKSKNVFELLSDAKLKFASDGEVLSQINTALVAMGDAKCEMKRCSSARSRPLSAVCKK